MNVTEQAATQLQGLLQANEAPPEQGVKLVPDGTGGIGMTIDAPDEGDEVINKDESPLLIVDRSIAGLLEGTVLDCQIAEVDGQPRPRFLLRRPGEEN